MPYKTVQERFWSKVNIKSESECWEWIGFRHPKGYGQFGINGKTKTSPRIAWILGVGEIPDGMHVLHHCDNPACCNPNHLFLGTNQDNINDKCAKKRQSKLKGSNSGRAKLTEKQVIEIRNLHQKGITQTDIAKLYKIGIRQICYIVNRKEWTHI